MPADPTPADAFVFGRARRFADRTAIRDDAGDWTYADLAGLSSRGAHALLDGKTDLAEARVAFLVPPGAAWVATQWATWRAGGIAVPLALSHPPAELAYVVDDAEASVLVTHPACADRAVPLARDRGLRLVDASTWHAPAAPDRAPSERPPELPPPGRRRAMIVYTSGSTGRPKGVVSTHAGVSAQIRTLVDAWGWRADDVALHVLPLHHVHGIINVLSCALWSGARCIMMPRFDAVGVWQHFAAGEVTVFMAVPTVYHRLIAAWEEADAATRAAWSSGARRLRLMVSGSAALPVTTLERWREITGHTLLERYGMTEIGMALSNPLDGARVAGTVGTPLPGVEARIVGEDGLPVAAGAQGEIEVRGLQVFLEYWRRPTETAHAFHDGWFRTGDIAVIEDGRWRILGRASVDIIKTAGYKVSALEIEDGLRQHPDIVDCAVIGMPDADIGERVCAALVPRADARLEPDQLRDWARERMAPYKVPRELRLVTELPRNALGKVTKPALRELFP